MSLPIYSLRTSLALLTVADMIEQKMLHPDNKISEPPDTVSIIIPALNEEKYIERCLNSLRNQSLALMYPEYFEYILVDNGSIDSTISLAEPYVDKILTAPKGKLTARNLGTQHANGNIIVSVDSDIAFPFYWLNSLLKPFHQDNKNNKYNQNIVGVSGSIIDQNFPLTPKPLYILASSIERTIIHPERMPGGNCAYLKEVFYLSGQFNTNINQADVKQMVEEEEIGFGKRLSQFGKVIYKYNAPGIHMGGEKNLCRLNPSSIKCNKYKIGIERFG